jgi:CDP-glycerol glycerophosphotransferase (TagB/SpsB family)
MYSQLPLIDERVVYVTEHDITPYLEKADVLISDVSSVMMEFAALDKPVVLFNNPMQRTYKNYNADDLEYTHRDIGYQVNNLEEMKLAVLKTHRGHDPYKEKRKEITDKLFANKYDGKATERIIEVVLNM